MKLLLIQGKERLYNMRFVASSALLPFIGSRPTETWDADHLKVDHRG